jgi:hypothetical protein
MPPVPAGTAPLKLEWLVNPEDLVDATDTNLILTMPKNCKLAKCLSTCAELPASPSSTDSTRVEVAYRWLLLILSTVMELKLQGPLASFRPINGHFSIDWADTAFTELESRDLLSPCKGIARLIAKLRLWRTQLTALPDSLIMDDSGWVSDAFDIDSDSFDPDYVPFIANMTFGDYGLVDPYPLYVLWMDFGEHFVHSQVATEDFWYRCDRVVQAIALSEGLHHSEENPMSEDFLLASIGRFALQTQWVSPGKVTPWTFPLL